MPIIPADEVCGRKFIGVAGEIKIGLKPLKYALLLRAEVVTLGD